MKIRNYKESDIDLVKKFLLEAKYEGGVEDWNLKQKSSILGFDDDSNLIGFAMQTRNELHDRTVSVEICIHPDQRRKGLGLKLYGELFERFPVRESDFAIDTMCNSENVAAHKFFERLGFEVYLKCYHNVFNISDLRPIKSEFEFKTLSEFYQVEGNKERIKYFHCRRYDEDHDPFVPVTKNKEVRYDYYSDGDHEFGAVLLKGDEIIGCSLSFLGFEEEIADDTDLEDVTGLHGYAVGESVAEEAKRVQALYTYQVELLKEKGHENVYIEFDSIEKISDLMLEWIPRTKSPLLRYQKRLKV